MISRSWILWWCHCLLLYYHSSSFIITKGGGAPARKSLMTSSVATASSWPDRRVIICHWNPPPLRRVIISQRCAACLGCHQSAPARCCGANRGLFCGLCCSDTDETRLSPVSKQTNNKLRLEATACLPHHTVWKQTEDQTIAAHRNVSLRSSCSCTQCNQKWCWITPPTRQGKCILQKSVCAKKNWNGERAKKLNNTAGVLWFVNSILHKENVQIFKRWSVR